MNVVFMSTVHRDPWPGSEYLWSETASRLLDEGSHVSAKISKDFSGAEKLSELRAKGGELSFYSLPSGRFSRIFSRWQNPMSDIDTRKTDVLVLSSGSGFDPCYQQDIYRVVDEAECPTVFICHFNAETFAYTESQRLRMKHLLKGVDKLVFVCQENADLLERQLATRFNDYSVIGPPLNLNRQEPLPWCYPVDRPVIFASVARLVTQWKGQDVLLQVLGSAVWKGRDWQLRLYGRGDDKKYLEELAQHYGIADRVFFEGHVDDRLDIWREADIQLLAARGEGGPMVVTEAMACGRISVTTRCGHNGDLIVNGENGFLADFATAYSVGRALEEAWGAMSEWGDMGKAAFRTYWGMRDHDPAAELKSIVESLGSGGRV